MDTSRRNWNDLKTAIGTQVQMEKRGETNLSIDQLLLNIKAVGFDSLVCQADICTDEDITTYQQKGYPVSLTVSQFEEKFPIDPSRIWYTPALSLGCLYFNPDTLESHVLAMPTREDIDLPLEEHLVVEYYSR